MPPTHLNNSITSQLGTESHKQKSAEITHKKQKLVLFVVSDIDRAIAFEWIAQASLKWSDFKVAFVFLCPKMPKSGELIRQMGINVVFFEVLGKRSWILTFFRLAALIRQLKPIIIHCHLIQANLIGLSAAFFFRHSHPIYTRHHSTLHHVYHPKGVFLDRYSNFLAKKIISISDSVTSVLSVMENVPRSKIVEIPHGFDLTMFSSIDLNRVKKFRHRHQLPAHVRIVGVVSRFVDWKGIKYIVRAFSKLVVDFPDLHLLLLNASGPGTAEIDALLQELPSACWSKVLFEDDIVSAYASMTVLVHAPIDKDSEAFGQVYVEALASGIPSVFTLSGISTAFVRDEENALVVPFKDAKAIEVALRRLLNDFQLCKKLATQGPLSVRSEFNLDRMTERLYQLYQRLTDEKD